MTGQVVTRYEHMEVVRPEDFDAVKAELGYPNLR